ncbi:hypothetical protein JG687_00009044 [Phytophthora cactorum]|uniref:VTT domain-containing protein n=1 Tax=Phytophthora cactorum TaxID=29920 RepID=A0A329RYY6_9STRA|nr:hypothetical protein Pcac1_g13009 [Phytophthora cactorum]KAG2825040.1 hypothetical protein PC112_g9870 [Phytophthora cactorum]KAG2826929.1 hypothetical protein PC111_g8784 [Phytophthora cactorum]KAG2858065.1 hypothetical protein PC113_g10155 [Phytophthora cactorum]KAG2904960.1 hypothetical protein PC115_g14782 [Phytophthora cactorum]
MSPSVANYSAVDAANGWTHSSMGSGGAGNRSKRQLWLRLGAFAVLFTTAVTLLSTLPVREYMETASAWVEEHLVLGTLGFILAFWVAVPLCLPATALEMVAGSLFGVPHGVVVITVGKTGGSTLAFLLGRSMGKEMIGGYLRTKFPTFRAFSEVLNSPSWKPVLLYQLSSIPNLVKIYSLAITHVSVTRFAVSSAVGTVPHAVLWAYIGEQATDIAAILSGETKITTSRMVMIATGLSLTVLAITFLVVYTKRQLQELQKRECRSSSEEGLLLSIEIDATTPASAKSTTQCVRPSIPTHQVWA